MFYPVTKANNYTGFTNLEKEMDKLAIENAKKCQWIIWLGGPAVFTPVEPTRCIRIRNNMPGFMDYLGKQYFHPEAQVFTREEFIPFYRQWQKQKARLG